MTKNPLACVFLRSPHAHARILSIEADAARALPGVADVRVCGAIGVIETHQPVDLRVATPVALDNGVWLPPSAYEAWFVSAVHNDDDLAIIEKAADAAASIASS